MPKEKTRLARLTSILVQLQSRSMVTATMLANKYDVSIRTIYRDIKTLEESGIPVVTIEGKGYCLLEGYSLPPVSFTKQEAMSLLTAAKLIDHSSDHSLIVHHQSAIDKIKAVLRGERANIELLDQRIMSLSNLQRKRHSSVLIRLEEAIIDGRMLRINYESIGKAETTTRDIEPRALYQTQGNWILIAYCRLRRAYREFRIDRMIELQLQNERCQEPNFDLMTYFNAVSQKKKYTPDIPLSQMPSILVETKINTMDKVTLPAFKIIGISVRTTNENEQAMKDIPAQWAKFMGEGIAEKIPNRVDHENIAMYTNYAGDYSQPYDMILGCRVSSLDDVPAGMVGKEVPATEYAKFEAKGDLTGPGVAEVWYSIWEAPIGRAYIADFEVYGERAMNPKDGIADIYVSIK